MFFYGFDALYVVLVMPFIILSLWASYSVKSTFNKYSTQYSSRGITAAQAAEQVLRSNGVTNVRIEHIAGELTDHFDPRTNVIRLSDNVYNSTSTAAIGVACHEAGHAVQYAQSYSPMKVRSAILPVTNIGSQLAMPLIIIGAILAATANMSFTLVYIGIACFATCLLFQLVTLPVEFNASRRAMEAIDNCNILTDAEQKGARKTLTAAAMTYVAAAAVTLAQLIRLLLLFAPRNDD